MRVWSIDAATKSVRPEKRPSLKPGPEELRIRVHASALNRADLLQIRGRYPSPPGVSPDVPGLEYAGEVIELGERVQGFRVGDRVMGLVGGGAFAEEVVTHAREAMRVPAHTDLSEAAAIPEAFLTAYDALTLQAGLRLGERVLIHAVTSGVGLAAAQLAHAAGAIVYGTSRSEERLSGLARYGVHHPLAVGPRVPSFAREVRALGGPVEVVLDLVGGPYLSEALEALAPKGRILLVGLLAGSRAELPLQRILSLRASIQGTVLRSRPLEEKIALARDFATRVLPRFDNGALSPVIDSIQPMDALPEALERMARSEALGKQVLRW
ncbi:MAG TPA: NAD(P)H-quinone oxidoreductase [Myxococcaceae bacterium]|nr:NAD(P)H-quinone oxidoreductase [Myxococcaceae bacterium]